MRRLTLLLPLLLFFILLPSGCKQSEKKEEPKDKKSYTQKKSTGEKRIVARVNNIPIYEEDLAGRPIQVSIEKEILYQVGLKRGLDKKFENEVNAYKKGLITSTLEREIVNQSPSEIKQREIEKYYNENEEKYTNYRIKRINIKDKDMAEAIRRRLNSGEDIDKIATDYSLKVQSFYVRGLPFATEYKDKFNGYDVGSVGEILNRENEFAILIIAGRDKVPLPKVYNTIKYMLQEQMAKKAIQEFARNLEKDNKGNGQIEEILYQEGVNRGLDQKLQDNVEAYKKQLILQHLNKEITKDLAKKITDKELEDYYNENKNQFTSFYLKKITTDDKKQADEIYQRASNGEDLEKIASDYGKSTANITVRDLGVENKYQVYLQAINEGKAIDILQTKNGFEIFKIVKTKQVPISKAKPLLYFNLLKKERSIAINKLKEENQISVETSEK